MFCTAAFGMGFDSPSVARVIHMQPPCNVLDYMQQIGRAGCVGQDAEAILHYNKNDIAQNLPDIKQNSKDYCKSDTCLRHAGSLQCDMILQ